jgi:predicted metal-dependent hydrolase
MLILPGEPPLEVHLRRSARTRRLSLRVSGLDGKVTLSLPTTLQAGLAEDFLNKKADWVRRHLAGQPPAQSPDLGRTVPVEGRDLPIVATVARRRARLTDGAVEVNPALPVPAQVAGVLKTLARARLAEACGRYATSVGRPYSALALRDTRSRWGSCSSAGRLMFSWRLVMAPPEVLDYVAAHEVAHLVEMNHSRAFWDVVARLCPDYARRRRWLRDHGAVLHSIRFTT